MNWYDEEEARAAKALVRGILFVAIIGVVAACVVKYF
jgi:hypothetical protein